MPRTRKKRPRDLSPITDERSQRGEDITMSEWLAALESPAPPVEPSSVPGAEPDTPTLQSLIARTLRSVAGAGGATHYDKAARLLRELRATDEYLARQARTRLCSDSVRWRMTEDVPAAESAVGEGDPDDDLYGDALRHPGDRGVFNPDRLALDRWLRDFLKTGPKSSAEVRCAGAKAGYSARGLRDARQRIGAVIQQMGYPCRTTWLLRAHHGGKK